MKMCHHNDNTLKYFISPLRTLCSVGTRNWPEVRLLVARPVSHCPTDRQGARACSTAFMKHVLPRFTSPGQTTAAGNDQQRFIVV